MSSRVLQTHLSFTWVRYGSHHWFIYGDEFKLNQYSIIYSLFTKCFALKKYEVFISSNLALLSKFTSGQSDQGSVHKLPTWFPLRLLLFKWPAPPLPPPPLSVNFPWSALYTLLSTTYIPYIPPLENHLILSKSFKTHLPTQGIKITTGRFGQMIWRYCLIDANCLTRNQFFLWYWRSSAKLFRASSKRYLSFLLSFQQSC